MKKVSTQLAFRRVNKNSSFYSKLICWWTKSNYYHVELIYDQLWVSSMEGEGVTIKDLQPLHDGWVYKDFGSIDISETRHVNVRDWIIAQDDLEYDWLGIFFAQVLKLRRHTLNKWFCSEFVTKILQLLGFKEVFDLEPHMVSPGQLAKIFKVDVNEELLYPNLLSVIK